MRTFQFLLILATPLDKSGIDTSAYTVVKIFASARRNAGNMCVCFGSEWKKDHRIEQVMHLHVTDKWVVSQLYGSNVPWDLLPLFSEG